MIVPFPPGIVAGGGNFSLEALMSNANAYAEQYISVATAGTNTTLTAAQVMAKNIILTAGASGAYTLTLPPTARIIDALGPTMPADGSFYFPLYISNDSTGYTATLTAGDASTTFAGDVTIDDEANGKWIVRLATPRTLIFQRISTCGAGGNAGSVTTISVVTANGFAGSVADPTTTPAITLSLSGSSDTEFLFNSGGSAIDGAASLIYNSGTGVTTALAAPVVKKAEGVYINFQDASGAAVAQLRVIKSVTSEHSLGFGIDALATISTTGSPEVYATAFGSKALSLNTGLGLYNAAFGVHSLRNVANGDSNSAFGNFSGRTLTNGVDNSIFGEGAMGACGTGASYNTAMGRLALNEVTNLQNSGFGWKALGSLTSGASNSCGGFSVGFNLLTGSRNVLWGDSAGTNLIGGDDNVGIGYFALAANGEVTNGDRNIGIGSSASPTADLSDTLCIGYQATVTSSGQGAIGTAANPYLLGINMSNPSAALHLPAGSTTVAPFKFTSGTNKTTAAAGEMEYNGTNLFFTRSGTTREGVLTQSAVTTEVVVSDTTITVNIAGVSYKILARA